MKTNKQIDAKLVEAYQVGNQDALAALVKRWHLEFCKKAYWIVKDADLSKDIAQESWQTIIDKMHTLHKATSFGSWALRIVYTKSFDALRQHNRKLIKEKEFDNGDLYFEADYDEKKKLKVALLDAIKQLPVQQQEVLKLFYTEDYSLKEISQLLHISVGTTKSRLFHAREKLKLILKEKR